MRADSVYLRISLSFQMDHRLFLFWFENNIRTGHSEAFYFYFSKFIFNFLCEELRKLKPIF